VFQILHTVSNKLLSVLLTILVPVGLLTLLFFLENINKFQNLFHRLVAATMIFLIDTLVAL
jgi:hypothetical protein